MVYLARSESLKSATISWMFNFKDAKLKIKKISLKLDTQTYENGKVSLKLLNGKGTNLN